MGDQKTTLEGHSYRTSSRFGSRVKVFANWNTVKARRIEEHRLMEWWSTRDLRVIGDREKLKEHIVDPELIERVAREVGDEFEVEIQVVKDRSALMTSFRTTELGPDQKNLRDEETCEGIG